MTDTTKVTDAIRVICNELNGGNRRDVAQAVLETVRTEHRTIQQAFWSMMLAVQTQYADNASDLRNEQAVRLAQAVRDLAKQNTWDLGLPNY